MQFGHSIEVRSRYNRSFQPWNTTTPALPPVDTTPAATYAWKNAPYEKLQVTPLPAKSVSDILLDPCYTSYGAPCEALNFPNLITSFNRNPAHATRTALFTRYTPLEWTQSNLAHYNESDTNRNYSERIRSEAVQTMRRTDEQTVQSQRDTGRRLGERITDITYWRNEVQAELERLITETRLLQDTKRALEKAIQDTESPLHITQECLYQREKRIGIDLVHDHVEQSLLNEVTNLKNCQERLRALHARTEQQLRNNRAAQHALEADVKSKEGALGVDNLCHQLNNYSRGINYYTGIEKFDPTVSTIDTWAENSNRRIQISQAERSNSSQNRSDADNLINVTAGQIWDHWTNTNNSLARRASETLETKSKLQMHLHKVQQEIFDVEKNIELLRKAIADKANPLKVAHTRLEARSRRLDVELCKDYAHNFLIKEVNTLNDTIDTLHRKLKDAELQHQQLLRTKSNLESDLHVKNNSLFIDREQCIGLRSSYPITATIKY